MIKLINFATKTTGQGVTIDPDEKIFSFDEALAMVALRMQLPPQGATVYQSDGETLANDAFLFYEMVETDSEQHTDPLGAVLRGLVKPDEL